MMERVAEVFARADERALRSGPLRVTDDGIFLATPLDVASEALEALRAETTPGARLFDAGMGDGRIVALAGLAGFEAFGMESDPTLFADAQQNLASLGARARTARGSFLDADAYGSLGLSPSDLDVVMNYPDGNEADLARFFAGHGHPDAVVAFLTPDMALRCPALTLARTITLARGFRLYVHRV